MSKKIDIVGNRYGLLTVLEMVYDEKSQNYSSCLCKCDCGNTVVKNSYQIRHARVTPSCGCIYSEEVSKLRSKDILGKKFGRLTVIEILPYDKNYKQRIKCICDCGNEITVLRNDVITGHTRSCGCLQKDTMRDIRAVDDTGYISESGVEVVRPYKRNSNGQLLWECKCGLCGKTFYELPAKIKNNAIQTCGCGTHSSGENLIEKYLNDIGVAFKQQYTTNDCLSDKGSRLRFDFAIFNGDAISAFIEYDGKQHYEPIDFYGGDNGLEISKRRDSIKDEYAKQHNIPMLRLPYYLSYNEITDRISNLLNA